MSIIIAFITPNHAGTFSEGRLTTSTTLVTNIFDKTLSVFNNKVICAFCGSLILDIPNSISATDVSKIIKKIAIRNPRLKYHRFLKAVRISMLKHLKSTKPQDNRNLHIVFVRKLKKLNSFEFRHYSFICYPNNAKRIKLTQRVNVTTNYYAVYGDSNAVGAVCNYLNNNVMPTTIPAIIAHNNAALAGGITASGVNQAGIQTCGGTLYKQII